MFINCVLTYLLILHFRSQSGFNQVKKLGKVFEERKKNMELLLTKCLLRGTKERSLILFELED